MTARCPSTSELTKRRRLSIKSSKIRTPMQSPNASAKGFCAAPPSRSQLQVRSVEDLHLTLAMGFERVLRNYAANSIHPDFSSAVHTSRGSAIAFVYADFAQSQSAVLGRSERCGVLSSRGRR